MKYTKGNKATKADRLTITLGTGQRRQLASIARRLRTSRATIIRLALDEYIGRNGVSKESGSPRPKPR